VRNENFGEIIRFPVVAQTTSRITFENPQHDFPRKIVYELRNDSALYVVVEGTEDGVKRSIEFDYKKMR
ncbi:MAG: hypothetical protein JNM00_07345, partial [Flavobacteriales bacterium]|nr:hypothetical protein [Flavobacteriales bacterium]